MNAYGWIERNPEKTLEASNVLARTVVGGARRDSKVAYLKRLIAAAYALKYGYGWLFPSNMSRPPHPAPL